MAGGREWTLVREGNVIEIQEPTEGTFEKRTHTTVQVRRLVDGMPAGGRNLGAKSGIMAFVIGGTFYTRSMGAGSFVCTQDDRTPVGPPLRKVYQEQTWEHFTDWATFDFA